MGSDLDCSDTPVSHASPDGGSAAPIHRQSLTLPDASTLLKAKMKMAINRLMATYLSNLEELADEHDEAMGKLVDALPVEHRASVRLADVYGEARYEAIRKHVLNAGNAQLRDLEELVEFLRLPPGQMHG